MDSARRKRLGDLIASVKIGSVSRPHRLGLRLGRVQVAVETDSEAIYRRMAAYFAGYQAAGPSDFSVLLTETSDPDLWEDDDPEFSIEGDFAFQRDFVSMRTGARSFAAVLAPGNDDSFHNFLRYCLPPFLLEKGSFLMHAAGVERDGKGYVFFGQSGAGKSTVASLISQADPSATLVGDDGVIIESGAPGRRFLHAAPLGCGYSREAPPNLTVPLAGIFALAQGGEHRIVPMSPSAGVMRLLASAMTATYSEAVDRRMEVALGFARQVRELSFKRDHGFWPLVLAQQGGTECQSIKAAPEKSRSAPQSRSSSTRSLRSEQKS